MISASLFFAVIFDRPCDYRRKIIALSCSSTAKYENFWRNKSRCACSYGAILLLLVVVVIVVIVVVVVVAVVVVGIPRVDDNSVRIRRKCETSS